MQPPKAQFYRAQLWNLEIIRLNSDEAIRVQKENFHPIISIRMQLTRQWLSVFTAESKSQVTQRENHPAHTEAEKSTSTHRSALLYP
ncbi:MAG: hypothetical protein CL885_02790 [Dehalococcoidia bacterium]|nr:hypothetical protein [Dehalococcoidia bacterium]